MARTTSLFAFGIEADALVEDQDTNICQDKLYVESLIAMQEESTNAGIAGKTERRDAIKALTDRVRVVQQRVDDQTEPQRNQRLQELKGQLERLPRAR